jgi:TatD DNase family protein
MKVVDSHAHLDYENYREDLLDVLTRATGAGVTAILTVACLQENDFGARTLQLIAEHEQLYAAAGVHPHDARFYSPALSERLLDLMNQPKVVSWGEIGLDFHYDYSSRDEQRQAFRLQLRAAQALGKPVIIHSREADQETCQILEEEVRLPDPGVLHCFTSTEETARRCLNLGFYISFGGILTFKNAGSLREIARGVPADRLLIETDSPYLAPVPHRGSRNEPAFVTYVAEVLAQLRGTSSETIAQQTTLNFERLFLNRRRSF